MVRRPDTLALWAFFTGTVKATLVCLVNACPVGVWRFWLEYWVDRPHRGRLQVLVAYAVVDYLGAGAAVATKSMRAVTFPSTVHFALHVEGIGQTLR